MPQSGIDLEPNDSAEFLYNVLIKDVHTAYNAGYGIEIWLGAYEPSSNPFSITITNHTDTGSASGGEDTGNFDYYISQGYNIVIN